LCMNAQQAQKQGVLTLPEVSAPDRERVCMKIAEKCEVSPEHARRLFDAVRHLLVVNTRFPEKYLPMPNRMADAWETFRGFTEVYAAFEQRLGVRVRHIMNGSSAVRTPRHVDYTTRLMIEHHIPFDTDIWFGREIA